MQLSARPTWAGCYPPSNRCRSTVIFAIFAIGLAAAPALADGSLTLRGAYYKERSTRVMQPMLDAQFAVGDHGVADGHLLVDAITSASVSSGAADTGFTERRYQGGGGYGHQLSWGTVRGNVRISREPDYFSLFAGASVELALAENNTIVTLGGGGGSDRISNAGAQGPFAVAIEDGLTTGLATATVSQVLSRNLLASVGYDLAYLNGYQQNPYRMVLIGASAEPERHPQTRTRHALAASSKGFIVATETTGIASYRFYLDSWGVLAHTPEFRIIQPLGDELEAALRYRLHWQRGADFYQTRYAVSQDYISDDEKLSGFTSQTFEAKLGVIGSWLGLPGAWAEARGELLLQYIDQNNRFGNAVAAQLALTLPFTY